MTKTHPLFKGDYSITYISPWTSVVDIDEDAMVLPLLTRGREICGAIQIGCKWLDMCIYQWQFHQDYSRIFLLFVGLLPNMYFIIHEDGISLRCDGGFVSSYE